MRSLRRKTLLFAFLAAMLMCVFTILLSFSFAEDGDTREARVLADTSSNYVSNIDLIIENSHDGKVDDSGKDLSKFYVVEVGSKDYTFTGNDVSPLYKMLVGDIESSNVNIVAENSSKTMSTFSRFVIDMHSSKYEKLKTVESIETLLADSKLIDADIMVNDKIVYTYYKVSSGMNTDACVKDLGIADLVYLSDPPSQPFDGSYDLPEAVKIQLDSVASAKFIPFIIDDYNKAGQGQIANKNFATLGSQIFKLYGSQRYTVEMGSNDIVKYLNRKDTSSLFLPVVKSNTDNWEASGTDKDTARILVISNNASSDVAVYSKFASLTAGLDVSNKVVDPDNPNIITYPVVPGGAFESYAYSGTIKPSYVKFEIVPLAGDATALDSISYDNYDMIFIESGVAGVTLSDNQFNALSSLVFGNAHIIYDAALPSGSGGKNKDVDIPPNYAYVYDKVATVSGVSRFTNVLVTTYDKMNIYAAAITPGGVEDIVKILNGGSYRGSGGNDDTTNTYNVLEIQPCYPIDNTLAAKFGVLKGMENTTALSGLSVKNDEKRGNSDDGGWYYLRTNNVSSLTPDEITYDNGRSSLSSLLIRDDSSATGYKVSTYGNSLITTDNYDNITDYYAWELSNAKIAHVTGRPLSSVNVVHMSSVEFNTSRDTLVDNFDMIYIGGDFSSLRLSRTENQAYYKNGTDGMTGNDFSDIKEEELEEYVKTGLPVVFSKDVTYDIANNYVAADTNLVKFFALCNGSYMFKANAAGTGYEGNALFDFDPDDTVKIPNDGSYGTTYGGMSTVFAGLATEYYVFDDSDGTYQLVQDVVPYSTSPVNEALLKALIDNTSARPKYVLTERPLPYQEGNDSSFVVNKTLTWTYKVTDGGNYTPHIYIDDNTNGMFEEDEELDVDTTSNSISFDVAANFYGAVYWKFTLSDADGKIKASTTDLSKIKRSDDDEKMVVNLLQLTSGLTQGSGNMTALGQNGRDTLFYCTECQEVKKKLSGVRYIGSGNSGGTNKFGYQAAVNASFDDSSQSGYPSNTGSESNNIARIIETKDSDYHYAGNKLGVHTHNFGIVKYDQYYTIGGYTGMDNWETNWAYDLLEEYDFNTNIMYLSEYDSMVEDFTSEWSSIPEADRENYAKAYAYIAQLYYDYYSTFYNYYIKGEYYSDSSGKYYKFGSSSALSSSNDDQKNDLIRLTLLTEKLCDSHAAVDQYITDFEDGNVPDEYLIDLQTTNNPTGTVTEAQLRTIFNYCESNNTGLGLKLDTLNKYIVAQKNLEEFTKAFKKWVTENNYSISGITHEQILNEADYEIKFERYGDFWSYKENCMNQSQSFGYSFQAYDISSGSVTRVTETINNYNDLFDVFEKYYNPWRDAKIIEQYMRDSYIKYLGYSSYKDGLMDLTKVYSQVVIGASEDMAGDDLYNQNGLDALKNYIKDDGHLLLFHESITNRRSTPSNVSTNLRTLFGQELGASDDSGSQMSEEERLEKTSNCIVNQSSNDKSLNVAYYNTGYGITSFVNSNGGTFTIPANTKSANVTIKAWSAGANCSVTVSDIETGTTSTGKTYLNVTVLAGWDNEGSATNPISSPGYNIQHLGVLDGGTAAYDIAESSGGGSGGSGSGLTQTEHQRGNDVSVKILMNKYSSFLDSDTQVDNWQSTFDSDVFTTRSSTYFSNRATRVNKGVVTMYPFMISNDLRIAGTHPSSFSANIYDKDMVVWYTLDGADIGSQSVQAAADPHDGADDYYIYSYGNVVYCGAGHTNITGIHRNNNDERRLLINIIVNSAHRSVRGPKIKVYDYVGPQNDNKPGTVYENDKITAEGSDYKMTVGSQTDNPNFTYQAITDKSTQIEEVKIYFDLTPTNPSSGVDSFKFVKNQDVLIYNMKYNSSGSAEQKSIASKLYKSINNTVAGNGSGRLQLEPRYFMYEGNSTAYIMIAIKTKDGKYAFQRIKVKLAPKMYDLT